jgi:uncharacterized protein (TIGR03435 family)
VFQSIVRATALLALAALALLAQDSRPQFEVASIKLAPADARGRMFGSHGPGMFNTENMPVKALISNAYGVKDFQLSGGPSWISTEGYTINAKAPAEGTPEERWKKMKLMLQVLLEDRFQLKFHRESKEMPTYALTVAKGGLKLPPADCIPFDETNRPAPPAPGQPPIRFCGNMRISRNGPNSVVDAYGTTTADLVGWLSSVTSRVVIDKTGHTGTFDAKFEYAPDLLQSAPAGEGSVAPPPETAPALITVLQEKFGLKLESERGQVEILVIDRVERPSGN